MMQKLDGAPFCFKRIIVAVNARKNEGNKEKEKEWKEKKKGRKEMK